MRLERFDDERDVVADVDAKEFGTFHDFAALDLGGVTIEGSDSLDNPGAVFE